ncbi:HK97 gp10 family phage protein [Shewanella sp.]|jgi:hypothetical protein|uniref:HK97 gp10 family phage protein n=1 Tax=Shewanella sp. TaxID=50422 RepID=UPI0035682D57
MELSEELASNAEAFSQQLRKMAVVIDAEISAAIRKGVLDVYKSITKRSPVLTGVYRASNSIANHDPSPEEGVVKKVMKKGEVLPSPQIPNWTWKVGDGDIWLFNNVPYAERIENGWSKVKAPQGVYRLALQEITLALAQAIQKSKILTSTGGAEG